MNNNNLTHECFMHILKTQCITILLYGAGIWKCNNEIIRKLGVSVNNAVRKVFHYKYCESVKDILRGFCILPVDLSVTCSKLLLIWDGIHSNRNIVKICAEYCSCNVDIMTKCNELGLSLNWCKRVNVKMAVWDKFVNIVGW